MTPGLRGLDTLPMCDTIEEGFVGPPGAPDERMERP
jgi:hypothetical protein